MGRMIDQLGTLPHRSHSWTRDIHEWDATYVISHLSYRVSSLQFGPGTKFRGHGLAISAEDMISNANISPMLRRLISSFFFPLFEERPIFILLCLSPLENAYKIMFRSRAGRADWAAILRGRPPASTLP